MSYLGGRTIYIDSDGNEHFDYERDYEPKPITNYDRIISKTPEELAVLISESIDCGVCKEMHGFRMCDVAQYKSCEDCWLDWLKKEADDGIL